VNIFIHLKKNKNAFIRTILLDTLEKDLSPVWHILALCFILFTCSKRLKIIWFSSHFCERTWWSLFQKRVVFTTLDINVVITKVHMVLLAKRDILISFLCKFVIMKGLYILIKQLK